MGVTPNQRVKRDAGSRQGKCVRAHLARSDWSARVRTRGIDWLGATRSHARAYGLSRTFYCEVTDVCVLYLVVCISFLEGSSRHGRLRCNKASKNFDETYQKEGHNWGVVNFFLAHLKIHKKTFNRIKLE